MSDINNLITDNIDVWTSAIKKRNSQGRGSNKKIELTGVKKLRDLILELAVTGKLVPQEPSDEPASVLIENIVKEKEQLIADKKIKKQKSLPVITDEVKLLDLPNGWEWCHLQDVSSYIQRGKGPKYDDRGSVKVISQKCIQLAGFTIEPARHVSDESLEKYQEERFLKSRDLLWNSTGTGTVGRINLIDYIEEKTLVADSHVTVIRTMFIDAGFIKYFISGPGVQLRIQPGYQNSLVSGSTNQVELNTSSVMSLEVPIPPLAEQHRIVAKVDELMTLCDQLEQQTEQSLAAHQTLVEVLLAALFKQAEGSSDSTDDFQTSWQRVAEHFDLLFTTELSIEKLKQTILQLAVMGKLVPQNPSDEPATILLEKIVEEKAQLIADKKIKKQKPLPVITDEDKPFDVPKSWEWVCWGELLAYDDAAFKRGPFGSSLTKSMFIDKGYKVYEQYCPINDDCSFERYYISDEKFEELKGFSVQSGDFLVSCTGATLGRITQVPIDFNEGVINQALLRVRINNEFIDSTFFKLLFRSPFFQKSIFANSKGSAIPNLKSVKDLKAMLIPFMPIKEQHRIVAKVDELVALCEQLKARLSDTRTTQQHLAESIISKAIGREIINSESKVDIKTMKITTTLTNSDLYANQDDGVLATLIKNDGGEADAKAIWNKSSFDLPSFYKQLKKEIKAGYINPPAKADY